MTWKSAAVGVGASVVATYLAALQPVRTTPDAPAPRPAPSAARIDAAAAEIQHQANRLRVKIERTPEFHQPDRNPFRFGARKAPPASRPAPSSEPTITVEPMTDTPAVPVKPTFRMALAGIAEDKVGDQIVRTAIISSVGDVLLVKEGDQVGGLYKVERIGTDSVELSRLDDGSIVRLALRP